MGAQRWLMPLGGNHHGTNSSSVEEAKRRLLVYCCHAKRQSSCTWRGVQAQKGLSKALGEKHPDVAYVQVRARVWARAHTAMRTRQARTARCGGPGPRALGSDARSLRFRCLLADAHRPADAGPGAAGPRAADAAEHAGRVQPVVGRGAPRDGQRHGLPRRCRAGHAAHPGEGFGRMRGRGEGLCRWFQRRSAHRAAVARARPAATAQLKWPQLNSPVQQLLHPLSCRLLERGPAVNCAASPSVRMCVFPSARRTWSSPTPSCSPPSRRPPASSCRQASAS